MQLFECGWMGVSVRCALPCGHDTDYNFLLEIFYPGATSCREDIITLLWFGPSVCLCVSRLDLVNEIESKPSCASSSNLADMLTMRRG